MGCLPHLHGHTEALVEGHEAAALDGLAQAVHQAGELAGARLAQVGRQPRPRKVQRVHNQQGARARQAA